MKLRLSRTEIEVSYTLLCLFAVSVLLGASGGFLWCAAAIVLHECGHLAMMKVFGYFPERIKISLFEISVTDEKRHLRRFYQNVLIIFFGPFSNFICFLPCYLLYLKGIGILLPLAAANLSVGLFNLLPVLSLDGGQLLRLFLCRKMPQARAERVVAVCTFVCIFPLAAAGFLMLLQTGNLSLLFVSGYLVFALICRDDRFD